MLKKAADIAIIFLLLVATGGVPVTRHYCGTVEKSFAVYSTPKACCGGHCDKCHNVFKFSKVKDVFEGGCSMKTLCFTDIVTLQSAHFIDLLNNVNIPFPADLINHRADYIYEAGISPASSGNFRC
jgi:hypothetical protein